MNTSKKQKRRKYFVSVRVILKHLIEVLISSKCIEFVQKTSKIHLIKNAFMLGSLWFYLLPLSSLPYTYGRDLEVPLNTTSSGKTELKKILKSAQSGRGWRRYFRVINQANFSGRNMQDKSITLSHHPDKSGSQREEFTVKSNKDTGINRAGIHNAK